MIFLISLILFVSIFSPFIGMEKPEVSADQFVDDLSVVQFSETKTKFDNFDHKRFVQPAKPKLRRIKRSSWSLPKNTTARFVVRWIVRVSSLNNSFSALSSEVRYLFKLPTYSQLQTLYSTLGRLKEENEKENMIDHEFFEEQRANKERRSIYQHVEGLFDK